LQKSAASEGPPELSKGFSTTCRLQGHKFRSNYSRVFPLKPSASLSSGDKFSLQIFYQFDPQGPQSGYQQDHFQRSGIQGGRFKDVLQHGNIDDAELQDH